MAADSSDPGVIGYLFYAGWFFFVFTILMIPAIIVQYLLSSSGLSFVGYFLSPVWLVIAYKIWKSTK